MKHIFTLFLSLFCIQIFASSPSPKDDKPKRKQKEEVVAEKPAVKEEPEFKPISEVTKKCIKLNGLFNLYQDTSSGKTYMEISEDQIGKEIIYFKHVLNGVADAQNFKGSYQDVKIFKIEKYFDRIELAEQNTMFYFDPENALSKASKSNINEPVVFSQKIAGMSEDTGVVKTKRYLIESDDLFLTESIQQITPFVKPGSPPTFSVGKLNKAKSKYISINNYPENTDVVIEYAFENLYPSVFGSEAVTNSRYISIIIQHSFIEIPDNDYKPRFEDSRVGYFTNKVTDLTSESSTPYRDLINKWDLKKKDPTAEISEPVKPITWWIENTTPLEIRETIKNAALKWNEAFELAGFKNALVIETQPDTAEWDAGDIRYNVIRWTSSPQPPFGGYGPRFANPRTGEIIGADIMLEYVYLTNRVRMEKVFDRAGMTSFDEFQSLFEGDNHTCSAGLYAIYENMFGMFALESMDSPDSMKSEFLEQALNRLVLHELGHTLGLTHNFCGSMLYSSKEMNDNNIGGKNGIASSVMDYHATNITLNKEDQGKFAIDQPGIYDEWAITYGYSEFADVETEQRSLAKILAKATDPALCYGNDADDMRSPGKGIDPRFMIGDNSSDPVQFSLDRITLVLKTIPDLKKNILKVGDSYQELRDGYLMLTGSYGTALNVITRQIGGVHVNRARFGDETIIKPLTPVPYEEQKRAMNALSKYAFSPSAFQFDNEILNYLQSQRRGFGFSSGGEDPQIHSRVLNMQKEVLAHVMHQNVMERLTDSELYGNKYTVTEMLADLTKAIFEEDIKTNVNSTRQNIQLEYINKLGSIINATSIYDYLSKSAALNELTKIKSKMGSSQSPNDSTKAHRSYVVYTIDNILDQD